MKRAALLLALLAAPASAHEWYPPACCSDQDCWLSPSGNVTVTPEGYRIESSGEVIPYDDPRIKPTPPEGGGDFHVCLLDDLRPDWRDLPVGAFAESGTNVCTVICTIRAGKEPRHV